MNEWWFVMYKVCLDYGLQSWLLADYQMHWCLNLFCGAGNSTVRGWGRKRWAQVWNRLGTIHYFVSLNVITKSVNWAHQSSPSKLVLECREHVKPRVRESKSLHWNWHQRLVCLKLISAQIISNRMVHLRCIMNIRTFTSLTSIQLC